MTTTPAQPIEAPDLDAADGPDLPAGASAAEQVAAQLDALFAAPVRITVAGQAVAVRGVWLGELPEFLRLYAAKPADGTPDHAPAALAWLDGIVGVLARLSGMSPHWIGALADDDQDALFAAMWQANRILFDPAAGVRTGPRSKADAISWATAAALLVEAGHRAEDIERYTLAQIEQYSAAHARLAADRRLEALSIARGAQADAKGFKQFMRALEQTRAKLGK